MPQPADQNCGNCRFLDDNYKDEQARCHRYPPQAADETDFGDPLERAIEAGGISHKYFF